MLTLYKSITYASKREVYHPRMGPTRAQDPPPVGRARAAAKSARINDLVDRFDIDLAAC